MLDADILTNNTQWLPPMGILFLESSVHGSDYHHGTDDGLVRWCYILYPCTHLIFCPLLSLRNSFAAQSCLFILLLFIHLLSVWYLNVSDWYLHWRKIAFLFANAILCDFRHIHLFAVFIVFIVLWVWYFVFYYYTGRETWSGMKRLEKCGIWLWILYFKCERW